MSAFIDITKGKTPAEANDIQQVINALSGRGNTPISIVVNDPIQFALSLKNADPGSRGLVIYAADGTTVLLQVDADGVKVSPDGTAAVPPVTALGSASGDAAAGDHVHGTDGYSSSGTTTLELLYAASWVNTAVNYTVAPGVLFVFCTSGVTITLPDATTTNRFIVVTAVTGSSTVVAAGGSVFGGSVNTSTGAILNGVVIQGDSLMYKSDGANWRAVG